MDNRLYSPKYDKMKFETLGTAENAVKKREKMI